MKLSIQADIEIDDDKSLKTIEALGALEDLKGIVFEIFEAPTSGRLSSGVKYHLSFVEPTSYELKLAAAASASE